MTKCTNCGHENAPGKSFCSQCGSRLASDAFAAASAVQAKSEKRTEEASSAQPASLERSANMADAFCSTENAAFAPLSNQVKEAGSPSLEPRLAERCPAFAEGLPEWDLVPPDIMVVRGGKL